MALIYLCVCIRMWRSEGSFRESVLPSHHVGTVIGIGGRDLNLLSRIAGRFCLERTY